MVERKGLREWKQCKNKRRFATEDEALKQGKPYDQRAYSCSYCSGYHLTKAPLRSRNYFFRTDGQVPEETQEQRVARAHRALRELERKGVTGKLREAAEKHLAEEQKRLHAAKKR